MAEFNYTLRSFKSVLLNPEIKWVNTYEYTSDIEFLYANAEAVAAVVVAAEASMHLDAVSFDRVTVSTWVPDSTPYNPENLFTFSGSGIFGEHGSAFETSEILDTVCWVKRIADNGRNGRMFYRGMLLSGDTKEAATRKPTLFGAGTIRVAGLLNVAKPALIAPVPGVKMAMLGRSQTSKTLQAAGVNEVQQTVYTYGPMHLRLVPDLAIGGVTRSPMNHEYFDLGA